MAKTPKPVNRQRLAEAIAATEANGPLANRQTLYGSVAERYNLACGPSGAAQWITPSVVLLRIKEWQMSVKTPIGKRGRPIGSKIAPKLDENGNPVPRKRRTGRRASAANLTAMRQGEFKGSSYEGLLQRIENGSLTARIKANCLACAGFVREEIRECQCVSCPLWDVRPYRFQSPNGIADDSEAQPQTEPASEVYALTVLQ